MQTTWICLTAIAGLFALAPVPVEPRICENVDIGGSLKNMVKLQNCTIVKGFVKIVLIDYFERPDSDIALWSFPDLRYQ